MMRINRASKITRSSFFYGICVAFLIAGFFLTSCESYKKPYVDSAQVISSDEDLITAVTHSDLDFFSKWFLYDKYNGYILDVIDSLAFSEMKAYADNRYRFLSSKNKDTNFKGTAIYILYCIDNGNYIIKTGSRTRALLDSVYPGEYYRMVTEKYEKASLLLKRFCSFYEETLKGYEALGFVRKNGLDNSLLSTLNLKLSTLFIPSDSLLHKLLFAIPFGIGMVFVKITKSIVLSALLLLLLYIMCKMAYLRHKTRALRFNIVTTCWWLFSAVYFIAFCCVINSLTPSWEFVYSLSSHNYSQIAQSVYSPFYASYNTPIVSTFTIILLVIVFGINWFINLVKSFIAKQEAGLEDSAGDELSDKVSEFPMTIITLIGGALTCMSSLIYVLIAYLLSRIVETVYVTFKNEYVQFYSSKPFLLFASLFFCLSFLFTIVKDEHSFFCVIQTHAIICWSFMALSAFILLFDAFFTACQKKNVSKMFDFYDDRCSFDDAIRNPIANMVLSDYALFAGLTAPLFLIGCILFILFPGTSLDSVGFCYMYIVGLFILAPCSVASLFIVISLGQLGKPYEYVEELSSVSCMFSTKSTYFNKVLDRAFHFGGLLILIVVIPSLVLALIFL